MKAVPGSNALLVCTDHGRHPRRKLGLLRVADGVVYFRPWVVNSRDDAAEVIWPGGVRCRTCHRDWQRRNDVFAEHLDALIRDGLEQLDVSLLR